MRRMNMKEAREILRLWSEGKYSIRQIARSSGCSPTTVSAVIERAKSAKIEMPILNSMSDTELDNKLYEQERIRTKRPLPDMDYLHKELKRKGVTLQLLWDEYITAHPEGLQYSRFCDYYAKWRKLREISMRQIHKAGEKVFVDWVGMTMEYIERTSGEILLAYIFVGVLGASDYFYTEAFPSMSVEYWLAAHINMFEYFEGVPQIVVPDNLKAGITKPCYYEPTIQQDYEWMANHYNTAVIPARVRKPKDKSLAEATVLLIERSIIAKHRNDRFFSIYEINQVLHEGMENCNNKPFQKMEGSRKSAYETIDKPALQPLPTAKYELACYKKSTVNLDYHVEYDGNFYSVPYTLVRRIVTVKATASTVELIYDNKRIALHPRLTKKRHRYSTLEEHMPENHKYYNGWNEEKFLTAARRIGESTAELVKRTMRSRKQPEQGYRASMGIIKLNGKYNNRLMEMAAQICLANVKYSYQAMNEVLKELEKDTSLNPGENPIQHKHLRGSDYYAGRQAEC